MHKNLTSLLLATVAAGAALAFMSDTSDVVIVKGADGEPLRINASDYDENVHKLYTGKDADAVTELPQMTGHTVLSSPTGVAPEGVSGSSITHSTGIISDDAGNASPEGQRTVALNPPEPPASSMGAGSTEQRMVSKTGSKWFVVDAAGNAVNAEGINEKGYKTEAEAWAAAYPQPATPATTADQAPVPPQA